MNVVTVKTAGTTRIMGSGDWHVGSAETDYKALEKSVDYAISEDLDVLLMGDLTDTPTRSSITSPWEQAMSPKEAFKYANNLLWKLQQGRKRVKAGVLGNHPWRVEKESGLNPEEDLYTRNEIPCLHYSGIVHYIISGETGAKHNGGYVLYMHHTARGGRRAGAGVNAVEDLTDIVESADAYLGGHSHRLGITPIQRYHLYTSSKGDRVEARLSFLINCGSFLKYEEGYGEMKQLTPLPIGCVLLTLPERKERHAMTAVPMLW